jgi:hypothetical protein
MCIAMIRLVPCPTYKQCVDALNSRGITPDRILRWVDPVSQESAFQSMDMSRVHIEYDEIHDGSTLMVHIRALFG